MENLQVKKLKQIFTIFFVIGLAIFIIQLYYYIHHTPISSCSNFNGSPATGCTVSVYEALKYSFGSLLLLPILITLLFRLGKLSRTKTFNKDNSQQKFWLVSALIVILFWALAYIFHIASGSFTPY
jgi:hypothetical protein